MNGVTSKGIFSRSATVPTGLLLSISRRSDQGSIFTRPPIGRAAIFCDGACLGSAEAVVVGVAGAAAGTEETFRDGTRLPRCALIRLGISFCRDCSAWKNRE